VTKWPATNLRRVARASTDHIVGGIYRISLWSPSTGITFNQFLIDDDAPTLVHTGRSDDYEAVAAAVGEVLDPARLANIVLLHWEGDENGGMDHHWDSMMIFEESTGSAFPSDLYLQPGEQPATNDNLADEMLGAYRLFGIFAHEDPVRAVARRIEELNPAWVHAMHGATIAGVALVYYTKALLEEQFAYRGDLFGRSIPAQPAALD
jgi:hypothetical protein